MSLSDNDPKKKKLTNRNALVHGLYAKDVLLPWDSREDFVKLHEDLRVEFNPQGRAEEEELLKLAFDYWHQRTLWRLWQSAIMRDPFTYDIIQTKRKSWSGIRKRLRTEAKGERTLHGAIEGSQARMILQVKRLEKEIAEASDKEEIKVLEQKMGAWLGFISKHVTPLLLTIMRGPNAEESFNKAYAPESLEKIMRLEAALDARISKTLSRLVGLKEFKRTPAGGARMGLLEPPPRT